MPMINLDIPGFGPVMLRHLVCDYSGTLSIDGKLIEGVAGRLNRLAENLDIHILTADTHGGAAAELRDISCTIKFLDPECQDLQKEQYILKHFADTVIAIGNGNNDRKMLKTARIGIAVCLAEGLATDALRFADIIVNSVTDALDLLIFPKRLLATLRF